MTPDDYAQDLGVLRFAAAVVDARLDCGDRAAPLDPHGDPVWDQVRGELIRRRRIRAGTVRPFTTRAVPPVWREVPAWD